MRGKLITFEGSEGAGKSTQIALIRAYLKKKKCPVVYVREPGGVVISEKIRKILLDVRSQEMSKECETLLYMAARAQLVSELIAPALQKGQVVLCDRFLDSTVCYQGYGHGVDLKFIEHVGRVATKNIVPDLTILFDIEPKKGLSRIQRPKDRIERRSLSYHNRVRNGFLSLAKKFPKRIKVIPVNQSKEAIHEIVRGEIDRILGVSQ